MSKNRVLKKRYIAEYLFPYQSDIYEWNENFCMWKEKIFFENLVYDINI